MNAKIRKKLKELWETDKSVEEISEEIGISRNTIYCYTYRHRDEFPSRLNKSKLLSLNHQKIKEMWERELTLSEIAQEFGVAEPDVMNYVSRHREEFSKRTKLISNHAKIKEMWNEGRLIKEIAQEIGTSDKAVYNYISRHRNEFPLRKQRILQLYHDKIKEMWGNGALIKKIAQELGAKEDNVRAYIQRHRDEFPRRRKVYGTEL